MSESMYNYIELQVTKKHLLAYILMNKLPKL